MLLSITAAAASPHGSRGNPLAASLMQSHQWHGDPAVLHPELVPALRNRFSISGSILYGN